MRMSPKSIAPILMVLTVPVIAYLGFSDKIGFLFGTSTDNAVVRREVMEVRAPVAGQVTTLHVDDGDRVPSGARLLVIDQRQVDFDVASADQARRLLLEKVAATRRSAQESSRRVASLRLAFSHCQRSVALLDAQVKRVSALQASGFATSASVDSLVAGLEQRRSDCLRISADAEDEGRQLASIDAEMKTAMVQYHGSSTQSQKGVDESRRGVITAPFDAIVGNRRVAAGSLVQVGTPLVTLVSSSRIWVEASFREDQLGRLSIGTKVKVEADALRGHVFTGVVTAIGGATVGTYANASVRTNAGAFTKLTQWVPLRIALEDDPLLARLPAGASCEVWL
jgi:membrane fusion protein, multidrug efflux system